MLEAVIRPPGGEKMNYIGLDAHKEYIDATVLDENGKVVKRGKLKYNKEGLEEFFKGIDNASVAIEAGYSWRPAYEFLKNIGYKVSLAHPLKTRLIADVKIKTDAKASEALAQLLMMGWLPTAYVPSEEIQSLRDLTRLRAYLVHERTRFKNKVHAALMREGMRAGKTVFAKKRRQSLKELNINEVNRCLAVIDVLDEQINELSTEIKRVAGETQAKWLMSIPGVGYFSAVSILAEIGDISRFESDEKLCSYAGLVPSTKESGYMSIHGRITKQGSPFLRWILEECVWAHLRCAKDTSLTRFFYRMLWKGKEKAAVATARKLLKVVWALLKEKREFHAFHN